MRLSELRSVPKEMRQSMEGVIEYLEGKGFELLGSGYAGSALTFQSKNKVIKVFRDDPLYLRWVEFARENPNNPYVPRVSSPFKLYDDETYAIVIERLSPAPDTKETLLLRSVIADTAFAGGELNKLPGVVQLGMVSQEEYEEEYKRVMQIPHLVDIIQFLTGYKSYLDLNTGNLMLRGSQFVITDPLFS